MHASLGLKQDSLVRHTRSLSTQMSKKVWNMMWTKVNQVHSPSKPGNPMHLHKPSHIWSRSPCLASSCAYAVRPLVKMSAFWWAVGTSCMETFSCWTKWCSQEALIDKCLVQVLLADNCWVSCTTAELSQYVMYGGLDKIISLSWPYSLNASLFPHTQAQ